MDAKKLLKFKADLAGWIEDGSITDQSRTDYSKPINFNLECSISKGAPLSSFIIRLAKQITEREFESGDRKNKRSYAVRNRFEKSIYVLVLNLVQLRELMEKDLYLSVPLDRNFYSFQVHRRYAPKEVSFEPFTDAYEGLKKSGFLKVRRNGFFDGHGGEPRKENLDWCIHQISPGKAEQIIAKAQEEATKLLSGPGRLDQIRKTFDYLRTQSIELVPGRKLEIGELLASRKTWPFRQEIIKKPTLVFDPSGTKTDVWNERGLDTNGPYDQRTFSPKQLRIAVVCKQSNEGRVEEFLAKFLDGLPEIKTWGGDRKPYEKGFIRRFALLAPKVQIFTAKSSSVSDYISACREALKFAQDGGFEWNLAIAQIERNFKELPAANNPYFAIKAAFLKQRIPIQEINIETISLPDNQLVYAMNNISVATYAKIGGTPWLLKASPTVVHELVLGLGSQIISSSRLGEKERVVGITTVFSSDGRYLLDDRTGAVPYEQYESALFETLSRSIERVRKEDNWRSTDAVRLIFHVFQQIKDYEADAIGRLVETLGISEIKYAFVHIVDDHPYTIFDEANFGVKVGNRMKGASAPERGLCTTLNDHESLLSFVGSREVKQVHHGLPKPTLLRLHRNSTFNDMTYICRQAFDFSNHSWRMFSPAPLPITIHYAELIARLLAGLKDVQGWDQDTMLGPVGRTRWFL